MKAEAVTVRGEFGHFNVYHWRKFKGTRTTEAEANEFAEELRRTLHRRKFEREEKQRRRTRDFNGDEWCKLSEVEKRAYELKQRDPNTPEKAWLTSYHDDGRTTRGWFWVPPDHPFHWAQRFRRELRLVDGNVDTPGVRIIPAELPPLEYRERPLKPVKEETAASKATESIL